MQSDAVLRSALEAVHHLSDPDPPWSAILSTASRLVGSDAAVLIVFEGTGVVDVQQSGADAAAVRDYAEHFHTEDVMTQSNVAKPEGSWLDTQALLPKPLRERNAYYVDFMCKHRMRQLYSFIIENGPDRRTSFGFQRASAWDGLSSFLASDRIRAYSQAVQLAAERRRAQAASWLAATDSAFDALGEASCLVHGTGHVVHASPAAKAIFDTRGTVVVQGARLSHPNAGERERLLAAVLRAAGAGRVERLAFRDSRCGGPLHVELTCANPALRFGREPMVFIRLRRAAAGPLASPDLLSQALDITLAEARVLHALATGVSLNDFALRRGVSIHTVRKQVAMMMVKMDCTRQVDLVRAALRVGP